jgi:hypothetical protein
MFGKELENTCGKKGMALRLAMDNFSKFWRKTRWEKNNRSGTA